MAMAARGSSWSASKACPCGPSWTRSSATIRQAGYRPTDLARNRKVPFALSEEQGVRLGLLMLAVKPLRKTSRMSDVSEHVRGMTAEEAYYWFSKVTDASQGRRSQKALRILLAKE